MFFFNKQHQSFLTLIERLLNDHERLKGARRVSGAGKDDQLNLDASSHGFMFRINGNFLLKKKVRVEFQNREEFFIQSLTH